MNHSILEDVKKIVGLDKSYTAFDTDIIMHINTVFMALRQMGIGPDKPFVIDDYNTKWSDFLGSSLEYEALKTYVSLRVRLIFDPPSTSALTESLKSIINETEFRLMHENEMKSAEEVPNE